MPRRPACSRTRDGSFTADDLREGLTAVISVKLPDPQFEGQTKAKLGNSEVRGVVSSVLAEGLGEYLETRTTTRRRSWKNVSSRSERASRRGAAKDASSARVQLEGMTLPGKLADCSTRDASRSEVYLVEGDSAGGSAKQGRNRE